MWVISLTGQAFHWLIHLPIFTCYSVVFVCRVIALNVSWLVIFFFNLLRTWLLGGSVVCDIELHITVPGLLRTRHRICFCQVLSVFPRTLQARWQSCHPPCVLTGLRCHLMRWAWEGTPASLMKLKEMDSCVLRSCLALHELLLTIFPLLCWHLLFKIQIFLHSGKMFLI